MRRRGLFEQITQSAVSGSPPGRHPCEDRYGDIHIVDDQDIGLADMLAVQAPDILRQCSFPRNGHRQEQRVEPWIVEPLANIPACRQDDAFLGLWNAQRRRAPASF